MRLTDYSFVLRRKITYWLGIGRYLVDKAIGSVKGEMEIISFMDKYLDVYYLSTYLSCQDVLDNFATHLSFQHLSKAEYQYRYSKKQSGFRASSSFSRLPSLSLPFQISAVRATKRCYAVGGCEQLRFFPSFCQRRKCERGKCVVVLGRASKERKGYEVGEEGYAKL